jgi:hypothetical protein
MVDIAVVPGVHLAEGVVVDVTLADVLADTPICDLFLPLHSAKVSVNCDTFHTIESAVKAVADAVIATPDMSLGAMDGTSVRYVWKTQAAGFRDVGTVTVRSRASIETSALADAPGAGEILFGRYLMTEYFANLMLQYY